MHLMLLFLIAFCFLFVADAFMNRSLFILNVLIPFCFLVFVRSSIF
jgi:hypothetical protein